MKQLMSLLLLCASSFPGICSFNILGIFPLEAKSHFRFIDPLMVRLAEKGHTVTSYNPFPKKYKITNYKDVKTESCYPVQSRPTPMTLDEIVELSHNTFLSVMRITTLSFDSEKLEKCLPLMQLFNSTEKYDLLITESFASDFPLLFAEHFKIPVITYVPNTLLSWIGGRVANPLNPSYIPSISTGYLTKMNFIERVKNSLLFLESVAVFYFWNLRSDDEVFQRFLGKSAPSVYEAIKNISIIFLNSHESLTPAFPTVPGVIQVGGLHINPASKLPKDIEKFINESTHGVVYFCMGSLLRGETFPEEKRNAFLRAFARLPQRVLWKWEGDTLPGKPDNIMIAKWMPQRDILAHPNIKLFISHGGLLGTSEAVYEGVPILGIPIFGDQRTNLKSIESNGAGEILDYNEISEEVVYEKITRLLNNPQYKKSAVDLSIRYKDRPMSPLDTAVYWTEYVIRHKGAPHLKTAAVHMPWHEYLLLDVIAFLFVVIVTALIIIYYTLKFTLRFIYNMIFGGKNISQESQKKIKKS